MRNPFAKKQVSEAKVDEPRTPTRPVVPKNLSVYDQAFSQIDSAEIVIKHLYRHGVSKYWFPNDRGSTSSSPVMLPGGTFGALPKDASVALKIGQESGMRCYPPIKGTFGSAVQNFGFKVVMKVECDVVVAILDKLATINTPISEVPLNESTRIQIIEDMSLLSRVRKAQLATFVREEKALVVTKLEELMIACVYTSSASEKLDQTQLAIVEINSEQLESQAVVDRAPIYIIPFIVGLAVAALMTFMSLALRALVIQSMADGRFLRMTLVLVLPFMAAFSCFFTIVLATSFTQIFGPVSQVATNSLYHSTKPPKRMSGVLPHITIQCPVYKESLVSVIEPTMASVRQAVTTYELQGGTASIFCNDDGMQLLDPDDAGLRKEYYARNNIGWVARPPHGKDGFVRAGRFKKASNMNFALKLSHELEVKLSMIQRDEHWTADMEREAEKKCFQSVTENNPDSWAAGDIRIGDIILLIDSDTRVPQDCLIDAASEFDESPDLAILQHSSGVMMVVNNYWEHCIAHFTNIVYSSIRYACASGDIAPFVGHNAFLRWRAIQETMYTEEGLVTTKDINGESQRYTQQPINKWWSEAHVSEDFEMSLKLQIKGYKIRLASYSNDEFLEGVSLTVYDELARWQKYAYGCSELVFHPLKFWFTRGPFTKLFRTFLRANVPGFYKFTSCSYIFSYYAIASAWLFNFINYFAVGWFAISLDHFYLSSWEVFLAVCFVFGIVSPLCHAILYHRTKQGNMGFLDRLLKNYGWSILLTIFLGGISLHVAMALLCHLFGINMQWGITAKELDKSNFWIELPKIAKSFKFTYIFLTVAILGMIILSTPIVPAGWQIRSCYSTLPLGWMLASHFLMPIVLNPQLMAFSF
ncbi:Putative uncharacterized protein [Taphrina deformans PYCC 5710]|uniref:Uncharacterized protein n=1 Tax=Taphrina deformans (strain PYCC 5710 / ATCC 11124 / CBS 356.35 / IMI 108563 / JCM 9778 / NBRC 8474) TaxID=1097556 RepID=R4XHF2_TAPDE|nr:Putative uncharacterized protein [Taphrina deformans PYCC 5710]|eukprot:CCG82842.1 Putative uncharacterized protein [Taphrina deformans PYCC 5710]